MQHHPGVKNEHLDGPGGEHHDVSYVVARIKL